jgi:hypothetical protein
MIIVLSPPPRGFTQSAQAQGRDATALPGSTEKGV